MGKEGGTRQGKLGTDSGVVGKLQHELSSLGHEADTIPDLSTRQLVTKTLDLKGDAAYFGW